MSRLYDKYETQLKKLEKETAPSFDEDTEILIELDRLAFGFSDFNNLTELRTNLRTKYSISQIKNAVDKYGRWKLRPNKILGANAIGLQIAQETSDSITKESKFKIDNNLGRIVPKSEEYTDEDYHL